MEPGKGYPKGKERGGGGPEYPEEKKPSQGRVENQQQTQPTYDAGGGVKPEPRGCEASAITTAPSLLPSAIILFDESLRTQDKIKGLYG